MSGLKGAAQEHRLDSSHLTAIGAFRGATLGFFDRETLEYHKIPVREQVEVLSLLGNITHDNGSRKCTPTLCSAGAMAAETDLALISLPEAA
jgi:predicted DNA-binding protein with PD1-like motif